ncbi:MAG: threonine synthase [Lachnospiraceae bacterium]|nr:threonine synthase [Lachnospiraceae bacterium]
MYYKSTRNNALRYTASQAVLKGLSDDGGLFVPEKLPVSDKSLQELATMDYKAVAYEVMKLYLSDYTEEELKYCIEQAYDDKFDIPEKVALKKAGGAYYLELFHGPTIAFKDMALSILPYLMTTAAKKNQLKEEIVILTATSGDTGKAALAGFADVPGTRIMVFYPKDGVSKIQEKQMVTQKGGNVKVVGIRGNFDDAQNGVKAMFNDAGLKDELKSRGYVFSSANSINIGRLVPQIVYYVYSYTRLLKDGIIADGESINFCVPTGNFGNILAAYFAKQLGVPVGKLICASNKNKVLTDFFKSGTYDKLHVMDDAGNFSEKREFMLTSSPSMDILISSNLERLIYLICGEDDHKCADFMKQLSKEGSYEIDDLMRSRLKDFDAGFADEAACAEMIKKVFDEDGYVIDPHTAVAAAVYEEYRSKSSDSLNCVIASTASPYKFPEAVLKALGEESSDEELTDKLNEISKVPFPKAISELRDAQVLHDTVCDKDEMKEQVRSFLN